MQHFESHEEFESLQLFSRTKLAYPHLRACSFLATHLAACDVALNPPCLPIHMLVRRRVDFEELHPVARVVRIWSVLKDIGPARDIDDSLRCADDICAALRWTTVSDVIRCAAEVYSDQAEDPRGRAFAAAMKGRLVSYPPLLNNPAVPLRGSGPLADLYRKELVPAFVAFEDNIAMGGKDPARADRLIFDALRTNWMRSMMLGSGDLQTPVAVLSGVKEHYSQALAQAFSAVVGRNMRPPAIKNSHAPDFSMRDLC